MQTHIRVQATPFDPYAEQQQLYSNDPESGALVSFIGRMRDLNLGQSVQKMTLEHYPGMTEKSLAAIVAEAGQRWPLHRVVLIHRVGELTPQDPIVLVAVSSAHRHPAFAACEFIIDYLKTQAPFWKKELTATGERWLDAQASDFEAAQRW